jgi:cytochrome P450
MSEATSASDTSSEQHWIVPFDKENPIPAADDKENPIPAADEIALDDINMVNPRLFAENKAESYFARLRREDPVHLNEEELPGRYWSLTKYDDIKSVDTDPERFSSAHGIAIGLPIDAPLPEGALDVSMFIAMDPPKHDEQRITVAPIVAPMSLKKLEPVIRERAIGILDALPEGAPFNWVDKVSIELTTQMLATLFDFPFEERRKLTRWSDVATAPPGTGIVATEEERRQELLECLEYFGRLWQQRKANPGHDLVSMLAHGENTKDMQPFEFLGNLILLIVGGNDTTRNSISGGVYALNKFPDQYQRLREDTSLIPNMVAEIIRWQTPLPYMRRTANVDVQIRDKQIKAGDQILMWYLSGNRDEDVFEESDKLVINRKNARQHLSFGFGIHRCMGNRLAEMQLRVLWEEIMQRFASIEVLEEPTRTYSSFIKGYTKLMVEVRRK